MLLEAARRSASRNLTAVDQLLFAARNYQALARKLILREHYLDPQVPRSQVAAEFKDLGKAYECLRGEFTRLWLAGCKDAGSFRGYLQRFDNTITRCQQQAKELR
jgi:hypothetical protein